MITPRLILGTARVAGGADERAAIDLIRSALDAGITAIDTAPSYGMGTAEAAVGKAVQGYERVAVTTKLGSVPPSFAWLRTLLRRVKRAAASSDEAIVDFPAAAIEGPTGSDFSDQSMSASLAQSLERLGAIDALLLHDISAGEISPAVLESLEKLATGAGASPGYAGFAQWNAVLDDRFPAAMIAQCAPNPMWLLGRGEPPHGRALRLHSIGKTGLALAADNLRFAAALERAVAITGEHDLRTAELAALYALAAVRFPAARLLVTSSHRRRLCALLAAIARIDAEGNHEEIAAIFRGSGGVE